MRPLLSELNQTLTRLWRQKFDGVVTIAFDKGLITGFWQVDGTIADMGKPGTHAQRLSDRS